MSVFTDKELDYLAGQRLGRIATVGVRRLYRVWSELPAGGTLRLTWPLHESWLQLI